MSSLPAQPYQVSEFSGGLTENFIGGGPTRYMAADNFYLTVDKKLEERYGSLILGSTNYRLPSGNSPVDALIPHDNQAYLLGVACPNIYVLNPNWTGILGPTGNPPLAGGDYSDQISWGDWSHHTLITNDSLNTTPVKIYRGAAYPTTLAAAPVAPAINTFQAVTAGLPALLGQQNIPNSTLLQEEIALANDLKTQMAAHMNDVGTLLGLELHVASDTIALALLAAAPAATDQASLFVLVSALIAAFQEHVQDVITFAESPTYHYSSLGTPKLLNYFLTNTSTPTTLIQAAGILDDLKTKFFMHEMAIFTHDQNNVYGIIGKYLVTAPHIGTITSGPLLTPSIVRSLSLTNTLKASINAHLSSTVAHLVSDPYQITFPDAVDLDSLYTLITWAMTFYTLHFVDSEFTHLPITTATASTGSKTLTAVTPSPATLVGYTVYDQAQLVFTNADQPVGILSSTSTTFTTNVFPANNESAYSGLTVSLSRYHVGNNTNVQAEQIPDSFFTAMYQPNQANLPNWISILATVVTAFNAHDADAAVHLALDSLQIFVPVPVIASYAYAFHYFYQYVRYDGVIFDVVGPVTLVGPVQTEAIHPSYQGLDPATNTWDIFLSTSLAITNIPTLTNGGQNNYDTANVQLKIFRTIDTGATYFFDGIVPNGTASYTDVVPDSLTQYLTGVTALDTQPTIYTSGGVVNFDPAPICKYITILNNTPYLGAIVDTGQTFLNRIRQGIQNQIDSYPGSFFLDLPDNLTGLSNTRNNLVAFCTTSCYQVVGSFNDLGQGQMQAQSISDTIGCVSGASIVRTDVGIFFAGTDGFYYTDGFQLIKLSSELNLTYAAIVATTQQQKAIYGCYDRYNRRVWWSTQPDSSDGSATQSWVFHVNFGVTANGVFTTASNGENYKPSSMIFYQGQQIRGDSRGYLFLHTPNSKTDPEVNIYTDATLWNTVYIPYDYASCALDFGTTFNRKWLTRISVQGKNVGNVAALITSKSDNGRVPPLTLPPLWFNPNIQWGQPNYIWGAPNSVQPIVWAATLEMDMWRRFPATQLRADYKQISIMPAKIGVYRYQDWPVGAGVNILPQGGGVAKVQLLTPAGFTALSWPTDVVGYTFSQQADNFTAEYLITAITTTVHAGDTFLVADPLNALVSLYSAWIIRGILKQQRLSLTSYAIHFTLLGKMQRAYHGSQDKGENAPGTTFVGGRILIEDGGDLVDESGEAIDVE